MWEQCNSDRMVNDTSSGTIKLKVTAYHIT